MRLTVAGRTEISASILLLGLLIIFAVYRITVVIRIENNCLLHAQHVRGGGVLNVPLCRQALL